MQEQNEVKKQVEQQKEQLEEYQEMLDQVEDQVKKNADTLKAQEKMIKDLEEKFQTKATEKALSYYFQKIAGGLQKELGDKTSPSAKKLKSDSNFEELYQSQESVVLQNSARAFTEKIEIIGMNLINNKRFKNQAQHQIFELEQKVEKCITLDYFRSMHTMYEERLRQYVNTQLGNLQQNLNTFQDHHKQSIKEFEEKVNQSKKDTLWQIKDCKELIASRISEQKVKDMHLSLEKKLTTQLQIMDEKLLDRLTKAHNQLTHQMDLIKVYADDKHRDLRLLLDESKKSIDLCVTTEKFQDMVVNYHSLKILIDDENTMMHEVIREQKDKMAEMSKRFKVTMEQLNLGNFESTSNLNKSPSRRASQFIGGLESIVESPENDKDGIKEGFQKKSMSVIIGSKQLGPIMDKSNMSRKGKVEYIEQKIEEFEQNISSIDQII